MSLLAVYGTLKEGYHNHYILGDSRRVGHALISNHTMYSISGFYPALVPKEGVDIKAEVYEIDDDMIKRLDRFEGSPHMYKREVVQLKPFQVRDNIIVEAYVYQQKITNEKEVHAW